MVINDFFKRRIFDRDQCLPLSGRIRFGLTGIVEMIRDMMQQNQNGSQSLEIEHGIFPDGSAMAAQTLAEKFEPSSTGVLLQRIQQDHAHILQFLSSINETCAYLAKTDDCASCSSEQKSLCASRAASYLYDLLDLPARHFLHEEAMMLLLPRDSYTESQLQAHTAAHAQIMQAVRETYSICLALRDQGHLNQMYRLLHGRIEVIFTAHEDMFDRPFLACTRQDGLPTRLTTALQ